MRIKYNNNHAKAEPESQYEQSFIEQIRYNTSILTSGAKFMHAHKLFIRSKGKVGWDGRAYSIDRAGEFLTGLLPTVLDAVSKANIPCEVTYTGLVQVPGSFSPHNVKLRPYQVEGVNTSMNNHHPVMGWWPRGIIQVATGGGKTEMAIAMYQRYSVPTLFLVQLKSLLGQTADRFGAYGIHPGIIGDGVFSPSPNINIATVQTLVSQLKKGNKEAEKMMKEVKQVFFDEAHGIAATVASGNTLVTLAKMMPQAYARWGLTATPFMRDVYSNNLLEGVTGSVLYKISSAELIDLGFLTQPEIIMAKVDKVPTVNKWPDCYDSGVVLNEFRTELTIKYMLSVQKPALVMCTQLAHAKILERRAIRAGLKVGYLDGGSSTVTRKSAINELVKGKLDVIICTTIFNAGIDIPQLRAIILASGGRSRVAQLQKLGRGLRKHLSLKTKVEVIDFWDTSSKILERHSKERLKTWESEGFKVTIC
jgi:superfamily II DNA or RNA helicase